MLAGKQTHLTRQAFALGLLLAVVVAVWAICATRGEPLPWEVAVGACAAALFALAVPAVRAWLTRWNLLSRLNGLLAPGPDRHRLAGALQAVLENQEERAFYLLEDYVPRSDSVAVWDALRWLRTLAGAHWLAGQRLGAPPVELGQPYPQTFALFVCAVPERLSIRKEALLHELSSIAPRELDALALGYLRTVDVLIQAVGKWRAPLAPVAEPLLEFLTGQRHVFFPRRRFTAWWLRTRPMLARGGGALLLGLRLLQRSSYEEAARMLARLGNDGLLSTEADSVQRAAAFLALFAQPRWRLTSDDLPQYFSEGQHYLAIEMGVLRYPTAELPEVLAPCRQASVQINRKRQLIDDALDLCSRLEDWVGPHFDVLLRRLLQMSPPHKTNAAYWRRAWTNRKDFEKPVRLLMEGIAAVASRRYKQALSRFESGARLLPESAVPLVNQVHVWLALGQTAKASALIEDIRKRFPQDGSSLISLGRLVALHLRDYALAEQLFNTAAASNDAAIEALTCLGETKLLTGALSQSEEYFTRALQLDPSLPDPKLGLARVYLESGSIDKAVTLLRNIAREGPAEATHLAHYLLYRSYRETGEHRQAIQNLERIPKTFFKEPELLDDIATHLESEQHYTEARDYAERAMLLRAARENIREEGDTLSTR